MVENIPWYKGLRKEVYSYFLQCSINCHEYRHYFGGPKICEDMCGGNNY